MKRVGDVVSGQPDRLGRQPLRDRLARGADRGDAALRASRRRSSGPQPAAIIAARARRRFLRPTSSRKLDAFANALVDIENVMRRRRRRRRRGRRRHAAAADLLFQDSAERQAARLLEDGRRPPVQAAPLPEHQGRHSPAGPVRRARSTRACSSGAGGGRGPRQRPQRSCRRRCPTTASRALYTQALDFVNAVRAYGAAAPGGAREAATPPRWPCPADHRSSSCSRTATQILDWQIEQAQHDVDGAHPSAGAGSRPSTHFNNNCRVRQSLGDHRRPCTRTSERALKVIGAVDHDRRGGGSSDSALHRGRGRIRRVPGCRPSPKAGTTSPRPATWRAIKPLRSARRYRRDLAQARRLRSASRQRRKDNAVENAKEADKIDRSRPKRRSQASSQSRSPSQTRPTTRSRSTTCSSRSTS